MGGFIARSRDCCQVQILGSRSDRRLRFDSGSKGSGRSTGKEWMHFTISGIDIDKENFTISGFREGGSYAGSESRSPRPFAETSNAYQLWFVGNSMQLEV